MPDFTFQLEGTGRSRYLIYEEPGCRLRVYLDLAAGGFDWCGLTSDFGTWTLPDGEPIPPEKQQEILERLAEWGRAGRVRIDIGPAMDMNDYYADCERRGLSVVHNPDGSTTVSRPKSEGLLKRIRRLFS